MSTIDQAAQGATKKELTAILSGYVGKTRKPANREEALKSIIIACGDKADPACVIGLGRQCLARGEEPTKENMLRPQPEKKTPSRVKGQMTAELEQLLRRDHGATVAEICEVTGWQPHTARGRISDKFRGRVRAERVRNVGPNKVGAKGSFTRYFIDESTQVAYLDSHHAE